MSFFVFLVFCSYIFLLFPLYDNCDFPLLFLILIYLSLFTFSFSFLIFYFSLLPPPLCISSLIFHLLLLFLSSSVFSGFLFPHRFKFYIMIYPTLEWRLLLQCFFNLHVQLSFFSQISVAHHNFHHSRIMSFFPSNSGIATVENQHKRKSIVVRASTGTTDGKCCVLFIFRIESAAIQAFSFFFVFIWIFIWYEFQVRIIPLIYHPCYFGFSFYHWVRFFLLVKLS